MKKASPKQPQPRSIGNGTQAKSDATSLTWPAVQAPAIETVRMTGSLPADWRFRLMIGQSTSSLGDVQFFPMDGNTDAIAEELSYLPTLDWLSAQDDFTLHAAAPRLMFQEQQTKAVLDAPKTAGCTKDQFPITVMFRSHPMFHNNLTLAGGSEDIVGDLTGVVIVGQLPPGAPMVRQSAILFFGSACTTLRRYEKPARLQKFADQVRALKAAPRPGANTCMECGCDTCAEKVERCPECGISFQIVAGTVGRSYTGRGKQSLSGLFQDSKPTKMSGHQSPELESQLQALFCKTRASFRAFIKEVNADSEVRKALTSAGVWKPLMTLHKMWQDKDRARYDLPYEPGLDPPDFFWAMKKDHMSLHSHLYHDAPLSHTKAGRLYIEYIRRGLEFRNQRNMNAQTMWISSGRVHMLARMILLSVPTTSDPDDSPMMMLLDPTAALPAGDTNNNLHHFVEDLRSRDARYEVTYPVDFPEELEYSESAVKPTRKTRKEAKLVSKIEAGTNRCTHCGAVEKVGIAKLRSCAGCNTARYCNKACQKAHWKSSHKTECAGAALSPN